MVGPPVWPEVIEVRAVVVTTGFGTFSAGGARAAVPAPPAFDVVRRDFEPAVDGVAPVAAAAAVGGSGSVAGPGRLALPDPGAICFGCSGGESGESGSSIRAFGLRNSQP